MKVQDRRFEVLCYMEEVCAAFMCTALRDRGLDESLAGPAANRLRFAVGEEFGGFTYLCAADRAATRASRISLCDAREVFSFVSTEVQIALCKFGLERAEAEVKGNQLLDNLSSKFFGQMFYIPRQDALRLEARNQRILAAFNGTNQIHLAREFGVGLKQVYKIIGTERKRRLAAARSQQREEIA